MHDELRKSIDAYIRDNWDEVIGDIEALVRIESVEELDKATDNAPYGPGPRKALDQALAIADRMGLRTHDCEGRIGFADLPGKSSTQIGIIGHVDVVPAGTGWSVEPYGVTRREGYLLGRGVIDDKGPLMVALHAVKFWADRGEKLPYTVRVLFGANEETNMKDVEYYRARYEDPAFLFTPDSQFPVGYGESGICSGTLTSASFADGCICEVHGGQAVNAVPCEAWAVVRSGGLESKRDDVEVRACGDGLYRIEAHGIAAHASTPALGKNAIGVLVEFLLQNGVGTPDEQSFLQLLARLHGATDGSGLGVACSDEHFGELTVVGGVIDGDHGTIRQSIDVRYPTTTTSTRIEQAICDTARTCGATFAMQHDKVPFLMDPNSPAVRALLDAYNDATGENRTGMTSKGGTYARTFSTGVSFGPEKPWIADPDWVGCMHGPDEGVSEDLLKQSFAIYARTIGNLMTLKL